MAFVKWLSSKIISFCHRGKSDSGEICCGSQGELLEIAGNPGTLDLRSWEYTIGCRLVLFAFLGWVKKILEDAPKSI